MADIKQSTVEKIAEKIKKSNPKMTSEQARKESISHANRINKQQGGSK